MALPEGRPTQANSEHESYVSLRARGSPTLNRADVCFLALSRREVVAGSLLCATHRDRGEPRGSAHRVTGGGRPPPVPTGRVEDWRAGRPLDRATFPVPSTSHAACGFPALRAPNLLHANAYGTYPVNERPRAPPPPNSFPPALLAPFGTPGATQSGSSGDDVLHEVLSDTPCLIAHCTADLRYRAVSDAYARLIWPPR